MAGYEKRGKGETMGHELIVMKMLIDGESVASVMDHLKLYMGYKTDSNCRRIIAKAYSLMKKNTDNDVEAAKEKYSEMYLQIYKKAYAKNDLKNAIKAIDSLTKLKGMLVQKIEQKTESNVTQKIDLSNVSDENLEKLVEKIISKEE